MQKKENQYTIGIQYTFSFNKRYKNRCSLQQKTHLRLLLCNSWIKTFIYENKFLPFLTSIIITYLMILVYKLHP